jgi:hypothetical protein
MIFNSMGKALLAKLNFNSIGIRKESGISLSGSSRNYIVIMTIFDFGFNLAI